MALPSDPRVNQLRAQLWQIAKQNRYTVVLAAHAVNADLPCHDEQQLTEMIAYLSRNVHHVDAPVYKLQPLPQPEPIQHDWKLRYQQAHEMNFKTEYPAAFASGHYIPPVYPKIATANGLTTMIVNYLNWLGYRGTRINVQGRLVDAIKTEASGNKFMVKKMIKSATRKGTADISSTIQGKSVMWEIKIKDKPSDAQLQEQRRERRAGGEYYFVHNPDEFLTLFDCLVSG